MEQYIVKHINLILVRLLGMNSLSNDEKRILDEFSSIVKRRYLSSFGYGENYFIVKIEKGKPKWYFKDVDYADKLLKKMEEKKLITLQWKKSIIVAIKLSPNIAKQYFDTLSIIPKFDKLFEYLETSKSQYLNYFYNIIMDKKNNRGSIQFLCDKLDQFDETWVEACKGVELLEKSSNNNIFVLERNFSVAAWNDSKAMKKYISKMKYIMKSSSMKDDEFLETNGILKNPSTILVKGKVKIDIGLSTTIDLNDGNIWGLPYEADYSHIKGLKILSIENLTAFSAYKDINFDIIFYLGGYASKKQIKFFEVLMAENELYHWGDLDLGGFSILASLRKNGLNFKSYNMNFQYANDNLNYFVLIDDKELKSKNEYLDRIQNLLDSNLLFEEEKMVLKYLKSNNVWYEQESLETKKILSIIKG